MKREKSLPLVAYDILLCLGNEEFYGAEIKDKINNKRPVILPDGSLYPALDRCVEAGLLEWRWGCEEEGRGGPRCKYFKATEKGKDLLREWHEYRYGLGGSLSDRRK